MWETLFRWHRVLKMSVVKWAKFWSIQEMAEKYIPIIELDSVQGHLKVTVGFGHFLV